MLYAVDGGSEPAPLKTKECGTQEWAEFLAHRSMMKGDSEPLRILVEIIK
jgi:hypothetical protein